MPDTVGAVPGEMDAVVASGPGGPEVMSLGRVPVPAPRPGEVLVRVMAAGVNRPDVLQRMGRYPVPKDASPLMGLEVAGEVAAVGEGATRWRSGDRVCALCNGGGYAGFVAVPEGQCLPWPAGYDAVRAAALPETHFTVWANLFVHGRLRAGETVLVHGGTSGIGVTAILLARAFGARVYATAGSREKCDACVRLGADGALNYKETDWAEGLRAFTSGQGVDVVLDMVGASYFERNIASLARDGRLVFIATLGGTKPDGFDIGAVMQKRLVLTGSTMRPRTTAEKAAIADELLAQVWPMLDAGECAPVIHRTFPLAAAAEAHRLMESSAHIGKIVLTLGQ